MGRKFEFVFVVSKKGAKTGRMMKYPKLAKAEEARKDFKKRGWVVSGIAKTSKLWAWK